MGLLTGLDEQNIGFLRYLQARITRRKADLHLGFRCVDVHGAGIRRYECRGKLRKFWTISKLFQ
jgi:hypothetical protein